VGGRCDTSAAVTGIGGVAALAYGLTRGGQHGWADTITLKCGTAHLAGSAAMLVAAILVALLFSTGSERQRR
jgi:hypothetical protein